MALENDCGNVLFDGTMDGLLSAVFDAFLLKEEPERLLTGGDALPLFCERIHKVATDNEKARRVWAGLEKQLPKEASYQKVCLRAGIVKEKDGPQLIVGVFKVNE